jgi:hypothetical protein
MKMLGTGAEFERTAPLGLTTDQLGPAKIEELAKETLESPGINPRAFVFYMGDMRGSLLSRTWIGIPSDLPPSKGVP